MCSVSSQCSCLSQCFCSRADLSSEVTSAGALDWFLIIWLLPPSPAVRRNGAWWECGGKKRKKKKKKGSLFLRRAIFQRLTDNKVLHKQFLKSAAMQEAGSTTAPPHVFLFCVMRSERRGGHRIATQHQTAHPVA